ncbi:hypothetical protein [Roseococcus sp. SYP-B2431]|uniref:hypothetical protein n=1 Tax=Roseococcus sp. SYP-B2431 TaxID=2496640 RepID=UPI0013F3E487|nr:hypothetical protein [Roseococcus sp. SYP-B2431]
MSADRARRDAARGLHQRLLHQGKIPFLSWHHIEELLGIEDEARARERIAFLESLPLVAWMRLPRARVGPGSITDILAAEVMAHEAGCDTLTTVRDHVRQLLIQTGSATDAVGVEGWVWESLRPTILARRQHSGMVAALSNLHTFNDNQTFGEVATQARRHPEDAARVLAAIRLRAFREAMTADSKRTVPEASAIADDFMARVVAEMPSHDASARELLISTYVAKGIDLAEFATVQKFQTCLFSQPCVAICGLWRRRQISLSIASNGYEWSNCRVGELCRRCASMGRSEWCAPAATWRTSILLCSLHIQTYFTWISAHMRISAACGKKSQRLLS